MTGMRDKFPYWESLSVRWSDQDPLGHVNNSKYFVYFEAARLGFFQQSGLWSTGQTGTEGPILARISCNFLRQLGCPADLEIGTRVSRIGGKSFGLEQAIFLAGESDPVADGESVVVWFDYRSGQSIKLTPALREKLERSPG